MSMGKRRKRTNERLPLSWPPTGTIDKYLVLTKILVTLKGVMKAIAKYTAQSQSHRALGLIPSPRWFKINKEVTMRRLRTGVLIACLVLGFIGTIHAADRVVLLEEAYLST